MRLQVLIATMHQKDKLLIDRMNIKSDAIIINQSEQETIENVEISNTIIKWINSKSRGLSRSRNLALRNANREICLLGDDDVEYTEGYEDIILEQFKKHPEADIISFQVEGIEAPFKHYYPRSRKINCLTSMKISSVEIAFRLDSIKKADLQFNEDFGAGSKYYMGEESIFLFESLRKGLKIVYVPIKIANLHVGDSTWFTGYNKEYLINRGAAFTAMSKRLSKLLIFQFAVRRYKLFYKNANIYQAIKYMLRGRKQYLADLKRKD